MLELTPLIGDAASQEKVGVVLAVGQVYRFRPQKEYSRLVVFNTRNTADPCVVIKRVALVCILDSVDTWRKIRSCGYDGWVNLSDDVAGSDKLFEPVKHLRRYEDWKGKNIFLLRGRIMLGCDAKFFAVTNVIAIIVTYAFFAGVASECYAPMITTVGNQCVIFFFLSML
jgi:hypothetical protein